MARDQKETRDDEAEVGGGRRPKDTPGAAAIRSLARARKNIDPEGAEMTEFLMRSASVYAMLELAEAIRGGRSG